MPTAKVRRIYWFTSEDIVRQICHLIVYFSDWDVFLCLEICLLISAWLWPHTFNPHLNGIMSDIFQHNHNENLRLCKRPQSYVNMQICQYDTSFIFKLKEFEFDKTVSENCHPKMFVHC